MLYFQQQHDIQFHIKLVYRAFVQIYDIWSSMQPTCRIPSNLQYKPHQIPKLKCFSSRLVVVYAQTIDTRCLVENEDVVGAELEWSTILLPTKGAAYIRGLAVEFPNGWCHHRETPVTDRFQS